MDSWHGFIASLFGVVIGAATTFFVAKMGLKRTFQNSRDLHREIILNNQRGELRNSLMQYFQAHLTYYSNVDDEIEALWDMDEEIICDKTKTDLIPTLERGLKSTYKPMADASFIAPELDEALSWFAWMTEVYWLSLTSGSLGKPLLEDLYPIVRDITKFAPQLSAISNLLLTARMLDQPIKPFEGIYRSSDSFTLQINEAGEVTITKPERSNKIYGPRQQYPIDPIVPSE